MINGRRYSWESVTIRLPSGIAIDIETINYGDERATRPVYGKGSRPRGFSQGNYKGEGDVGLIREEYERLAARAGGAGIYGMEPFPIIVSYADKGLPTVTDTLESCMFVKRETGAEQDDEKIDVKVSFVILDDLRMSGKPSFIER